MKIRVAVTRKDGLSDPEGVATARALAELGFAGVADVHFGRIITLDVDAADAASARAEVTAMCEQLLANPVIEDYAVEVLE
jgi:phosphoribosylformylglycinamidine synthase